MGDTRLRIPGLAAPGEIIIDRWGIPHIYADSIDDLYFLQGFNAARDRLFQIDLWRRRGLGRLAEVFGPAYVEQDRLARQFLYSGDMAAEWAAYGFEAERIASSFVAGINARIEWLGSNRERLPPEFVMLGYQPAEWSPSDVVRIRSHGLQLNVSSELLRAKLLAAGGQTADRLRIRLRPDHSPRVPEGIDLDLPDQVRRAFELGTAPAPVGEGSNAWAVAASRTTTGRPLLACDPHRAYSTPSLRYIVHLCAPGLDVIGAGEPALPGISAGHNGTAAIGFTIFPADVQDLYVYELDSADPNRYRYLDGWREFRRVPDVVAVKDAADRDVELMFTCHGPVIHVDRRARRAYAVRTIWTEPGTAPYFGSIGYLGAKTWNEFRAALGSWRSPAENLLYADVSGTIGWKSAGLVPRRVGYDGLLPVPGDGSCDWNGFYASEEFPESVDPPAGFCATANQFNLPDDFPSDRRLTYEWADPARHQRIVEELSQARLFSMEDMKRLQTDLLSVAAREVIERIRGVRSNGPEVAAAMRMLCAWDAVESADSAPAALYNLWVGRHLGPAIAERLLAEPAAKLLPAIDPEVLRDVLRRPVAWFGSGGETELRDMIRATLGEAYREAVSLLGADSSRWAWGALHQNVQPHPFGGVDPSLDVGPVPIGGSGATVNAAAYVGEDFREVMGASFRMVVDVGEWDNSVCVNTPGQSGDPRSPHYRDLFELWRNNQYVPMLYTRQAVEANAADRMELLPVPRCGSTRLPRSS